ncbi:MAG: hypothetical protein JWO03_2771 [Bacteroidetes bacterium]|nr:hypothetical protein [Bacteroidota bacterium]
MAHSITAILFKGPYNKEIANDYDLLGISVGFDLTLFFI